MTNLWAGVGRCDITPAPGTPQGGWGAQTHQRGLGSDLPFYATALVVSTSDVSAVIIDVDSIGFDKEWTVKIIDTVAELTRVPREHVRLSCSHTHSGANTFRLGAISEGLDMARQYLDGLPLRIAGAAWHAQQNLKQVRCAAGTGTCEIGVNRRFKTSTGQMVVGRNWNGPVDNTVRVVRFDDLDEHPVATIVHYACHPTTMAWQCQYFTPDYPGMARQVVEDQALGTCLFLQGAAGDVHTRRGHGGDLQVYRRWGKLLGLEASRVATGIETLPRRETFQGLMPSGATIALYKETPEELADPTVSVVSRVLELPLKQFSPPDQLDAETKELLRELESLRRKGDDDEIRLATARVTQSGIQSELARQFFGKTHADWQLQAIRIGAVALLSIPGEPFVEISQQIVKGSPFQHTLFSGYSNGGFGYLPIRTAYEEGGYEVDVTPFSPDAAEIVVSKATSLLRELQEL